MDKKEYNDEPVYYCKRCFSLRIMRVNNETFKDASYCDNCGSTKIGVTSIEKWQELQKTHKDESQQYFKNQIRKG